jgi:hypothetical protein
VTPDREIRLRLIAKDIADQHIPYRDTEGRPYIADVKQDDPWYFPAGYPHSLQGLGPTAVNS